MQDRCDNRPMHTLVLIVVLAIVSAAVVGVGDRVRLPWPALMVVVGALVALVPGLSVEIDPDLILPIFLPPLLYSAAQRTSWQVMRRRWKSLVWLAVGLVVVTVAAASATAMAIIPGITVAAAIALGAMVAPPDPVAVESVAGSVPIPRRVLMTLQSEGLFNDAASLVVFQLALSAALTGDRPDLGAMAVGFLVGAVVAVAVGWVCAWLVRRGTDLIDSPMARSSATLALPFLAYLVAEHFGASGVIAVVVTGLQMRSSEDPTSSGDRLTQDALWGVLETCITGVAFGLIGLEIRQIALDVGPAIGRLFLHGLVIALVLVLVRAGWFLLMWAVVRRGAVTDDAPRSGRDVVVMTWGGMRGLATLALALSLPATLSDGTPFPARDAILVVAIAVLFVTLLIAGLTLPALVHRLHVDSEAESESAAEQALRTRMMTAATAAVVARSDVPPALVDRLAEWARRVAESTFDEAEGGTPKSPRLRKFIQKREAVASVRRASLEACRAEVVQARREPGTDPEVTDRILRSLDMRLVALDAVQED